MKFSQFLNEREKAVIFTFGRMNPITKGHEENVNQLIKLGKKYKAEPMLFLSQSNDNKKNPLEFKDKVALANKFFVIKVSENPKLKNAFQILEDLGKTYKTVYFVVGDDRVQEFRNQMTKYTKDWGIDTFEVISSGKRTKGVSGTDMRKFAVEDDFESFKANAPKKAKEADIKVMFDKVKEGLK